MTTAVKYDEVKNKSDKISKEIPEKTVSKPVKPKSLTEISPTLPLTTMLITDEVKTPTVDAYFKQIANKPLRYF